MKLLSIWFFIIAVMAAPFPAPAADFQDAVKTPIDASISIRQRTQKEEDRWAEERDKLEAEYDRLVKQRHRLLEKRDLLHRKAAVLKTAVDTQRDKLQEISRITTELGPFLDHTYRRIADLVKGDSPFLIDERKGRLHLLRKTLDDPLTSTGEKFRKVMEAVSVEAEYGNTVEIYQEKIRLGDREILADIFRLGRLSLFFKTLDGKTVGHWDPAAEAWRPLVESYLRPIQDAMEMAAKRRSVEVVSLPVGRIASP